MLRKILLFLLFTSLIFPSLSFATSCAPRQTPLSFPLINERYEIIAFKVLGVNPYSVTAIDVEVTHRLSESTIESDRITISRGELLVSYPPISGFLEGSEWVSAIYTYNSSNNYYSFYGCVRGLQIQNGIITGPTGLDSLDNLSAGFSIEQLDLALKSYQQGLQAADLVCQSENSSCDGARATYDKHSGVLNLPSVKFEILGYPAYLKAKMQLSNDGSGKFSIIELENYSEY